MPFDQIFMIEKGSMGLYVYPYGNKKLMTILKTQDLIGEYNLNFISSRAAQYKAITNVKVIEFPKEKYEEIIFQMKNKIFHDNHEYFTNNFEVFK